MAQQNSLFGPEPGEDSTKQTGASKAVDANEPLAARMRPRTLDEIVGQEHLLGPDKILRRVIEGDTITSMIFWGPPGSGKTTLAEVISHHTHSRFVRLSAVSAGVADLRKTMDEAKKYRQIGKRTILFVDEIHRFNKAQQDAILPHVESGTVTLIGATTENPSFEVNAALLSRARVFVLYGLNEQQVITILRRALRDKERGLGRYNIAVDDDALYQIAVYANGDARTALNVLELAVQGDENSVHAQASNAAVPSFSSKDAIETDQGPQPRHITVSMIEEAMQHRALLYDKSGDQHYDTISALHKAVRGSDPDGSLYWLVRMLEAGEDPLYLARRIIRMASEDIGMADPQALAVCVAAQQAVHFVGMPEAGVMLAQAVVYLATAPKSNAVYMAYNRIQEEVRSGANDPVPLWIRNAPTNLMKNLDYGKDYKYSHDYYKDMQSDDPNRPPAAKLQEYLPERLTGREFYQPSSQGQEASIQKWLEKRREK